MASTAITSKGTDITIGAVAIANVVSFTGFDGESAEIDVSNLQSTSKEYLVGLSDGGGSFTMEVHPDFSDPGQEAVRAAALSGASSAFVLTLSDLSTATFNALVKNGTSMNGAVDAAIAGSFSLKVTGDVTFA